FEPLDSIDQLALVIPQGGSETEFGIVGAGRIESAALVECDRKVIAARSGQAVSTRIGSFTSVRDASPTGSHGAGEIAVREGGPLLIGSGSFLRTMIDTADGSLPTIRVDQGHAALRATVAEEAAIVLTLVLSPAQRATIADEVSRSAGKAPASLQSIVAAALGAKVTKETVQLHGVVLATSDDEA